MISNFSEEYKATLNLINCFYAFDSEGNVSFIQAENDYSNDAIVGSREFKTVTFKSVFDNKKPEAVALIPENNKDNFS